MTDNGYKFLFNEGISYRFTETKIQNFLQLVKYELTINNIGRLSEATDVMESYLSYLFLHYFKLQTILLAYEFAYFLYFTVLVNKLYKVDAVGT